MRFGRSFRNLQRHEALLAVPWRARRTLEFARSVKTRHVLHLTASATSYCRGCQQRAATGNTDPPILKLTLDWQQIAVADRGKRCSSTSHSLNQEWLEWWSAGCLLSRPLSKRWCLQVEVGHGLERHTRLEQGRFIERSADDLHTDRQPIGVKTARNGE